MTVKKRRISSIRTELLRCLLVGMTITAVIGGVAFWINAKSRTEVGRNLAYAAELKDRALQMHVSMLEARRSEKDFFLRRDRKYVDKVRRNMADLKDAARRLVEEARDENVVAAAKELLSYAERYETEFLIVADAVGEKGGGDEGVVGRFRATVHTIEALLKKYQTVALERDMLTIRRAEKDYLLRGYQAYVQKTADSVRVFVANLKASDLPPDIVARIAELMDEYATLFDQVVSLDARIAADTATFRDTVHSMEPVLERLVVEGVGAWEESVTSYKRFLSIATWIILALVVGGISAAMMLGVKLASRLAGPLVAGVGVAEAIAAGDLTVEVNVEELGSCIETARLAESLQTMVSSLRSLFGDVLARMREAVSQVSAGSEQVAQAGQSLSEGSAEQAGALEEVTASLNQINSQAGQNSDAAAEATSVRLDEIVAGAARIADFLEEIALAGKEQAQAIEQINQGLSQIDQVTQSNTANAEQSAAAAEELASQARQLGDLVSRFKLIDDDVGEQAHRRPTRTGSDATGGKRIRHDQPEGAKPMLRKLAHTEGHDDASRLSRARTAGIA